jgi:hypothetical protein
MFYFGKIAFYHWYIRLIALMMEAVTTSKMSVKFCETIRRKILDDSHLNKPHVLHSSNFLLTAFIAFHVVCVTPS